MRSRYDHALGRKPKTAEDLAQEIRESVHGRRRNPCGTIPDDVMQEALGLRKIDAAAQEEARRKEEEADRSLGVDIMFEAHSGTRGRVNAATVHASYRRLPEDQKRSVLRRIREWTTDQLDSLSSSDDDSEEDFFRQLGRR